MIIRYRTSVLTGLLLITNSFSNVTIAEETCISVFRPTPTKAYRYILDDITNGIDKKSDIPVKIFDVNKNSDDSIAHNSPCGLSIGIGRIGMQYAEKTGKQTVAGAVFIPAGKKVPFNIYSLIPKPSELFKRLQHFSPETKKVTVIYSEKYSSALIEAAIQQAKDYNLTIDAVSSNRIQDSLRHYEKFFNQANSKTDALWIIQDPISIDNGAVLEYILEEAWDKDVIMFSSQAALAKQGALFSVYANNTLLGERLAHAVQNTTQNNGNVKLLTDLYTAFNRRTASHVGLKYKKGKYIDQIFPQ